MLDYIHQLGLAWGKYQRQDCVKGKQVNILARLGMPLGNGCYRQNKEIRESILERHICLPVPEKSRYAYQFHCAYQNISEKHRRVLWATYVPMTTIRRKREALDLSYYRYKKLQENAQQAILEWILNET